MNACYILNLQLLTLIILNRKILRHLAGGCNDSHVFILILLPLVELALKRLSYMITMSHFTTMIYTTNY